MYSKIFSFVYLVSKKFGKPLKNCYSKYSEIFQERNYKQHNFRFSKFKKNIEYKLEELMK